MSYWLFSCDQLAFSGRKYIFLILCMTVPLSAVEKPCSQKDSPVINICENGIIKQDINTYHVMLRADLEKNCTCELFITNQTSSQNVMFKRYGEYSSSHPGTFSCGLKIDFFHNADRFRSIDCSMVTFSRQLPKFDKFLMKSIIVNGSLPDNSGYCIEMIKEHETGANGHNVLNLQCGLDSEIVTSSTFTSLSASATSSISSTWSIKLPGQHFTLPEEATNIFIESSTLTRTFTTITSVIDVASTNLSPKQALIEDSNDITYVAVGSSVTFLGISVVIAVIIFVCKTQRRNSKKTWLQTAEPPGHFSKTCGQDNVIDCELQYNALYNMATRMDQRDDENPNRTNAVDDMSSESNEYKYSTVNFECNYRGVDHMGGDNSTVGIDNVPSSINDDLEMHYQTVSEASNKNDLPTYEDSTPTIDLCRSNHDYTVSTEGISNNDIHVYAVPDKRRTEHIIEPSGSLYAVVNK